MMRILPGEMTYFCKRCNHENINPENKPDVAMWPAEFIYFFVNFYNLYLREIYIR